MVEGLLDAAAAQAHWLVEVVAYVAGAPALSQLRTIARHGIVAATICPDPDSGGEAGILSFLRNLDPKIRGYVAPELPDGHDSDEFSLSRGVGARREQIGRVERGPIYRARSILKKHDHELATDRGRDAALDELTCYAAEVQARDLDDIVEVAAVPLGMQAETLRSVLGALAIDAMVTLRRARGTAAGATVIELPEIFVSRRQLGDVTADAPAALEAANAPRSCTSSAGRSSGCGSTSNDERSRRR